MTDDEQMRLECLKLAGGDPLQAKALAYYVKTGTPLLEHLDRETVAQIADRLAEALNDIPPGPARRFEKATGMRPKQLVSLIQQVSGSYLG